MPGNPFSFFYRKFNNVKYRYLQVAVAIQHLIVVSGMELLLTN